MSQKFRLQRVLDLKEQLEDLLQIQVAAIEGHRLDLQRQLDGLRLKWSANSTAGEANGLEPLDPGEMEEIAEYLAALERQIQSRGESLTQVGHELDAKRAELEVAYQEKELLQRLKDKRAALERRDEQRRDTRLLEDVSTSQYVRRGGSGGNGDSDRAGEEMTERNGNGHANRNGPTNGNGNGHPHRHGHREARER